MKESEDLFTLIKSMSKPEKRHFKLFVSSNKNNKNYIRLFDIINKQKKYDETKIKKAFHGELFIKQLHTTKYYLYHLILRALRQYSGENSIETRIRLMLDNYQTLLDKKLFEQAEKFLLKTKVLAIENEQYSYAMEVLAKEERFLFIKYDLVSLDKHIDRIYAEQSSLIKKIENKKEYFELFNKFTILYKKLGRPRNKSGLKPYDEIINNPLLKNINNALGDLTIGIFYAIHHTYSYLNCDYKKTLYWLRGQRAFIESSTLRREKYIGDLILCISNQTTINIKTNSFNDAEVFLKDLYKIYEKSYPKNDMSLTLYYLNSMYLHGKMGDFEEAVVVAKKTERWVSEISSLTRIGNANIQLYLKLSYSYFGVANYRKALFWINKILNEKEKGNIRSDLYFSIIIYNLILHYELKNQELLPYLTKSTYRLLVKNNKLFKLENIIIDFIRKTSLSFRNPNEEIKAFQSLRNSIVPLKNNRYENLPFDFFDFTAWLDSKINKTSFAEEIRKSSKDKIV